MRYCFFDSVEVLTFYQFEEDDKKILINENHSDIPEGVLYEDNILQSDEPFGFRVIRMFGELGITDYGDYRIVTEYPEQYNGIISDKHIMKWDSDKAEADDFHSDLVQLINKGYAKTPMGMKIVGGELISKTVEEAESDEERSLLANNEINSLKIRLSETDYVVIKIAEGEATSKDYESVLKERKAARERIGELEKIVKSATK